MPVLNLSAAAWRCGHVSSRPSSPSRRPRTRCHSFFGVVKTTAPAPPDKRHRAARQRPSLARAWKEYGAYAEDVESRRPGRDDNRNRVGRVRAGGESTGTIEVFVTDPQGQTLPGATVEASAVNTTTKRVAVTDENGKAVLELLEPSEVYTVKITMQGFKEQVRENQLVRVAQVLTIRSALVLPGVEEAVTVSAETTPLVDVRSATTGSDITLRLTESLPTGRSYQSYLQLVPGVLPDDPSAAGQPGLAFRSELQRHRRRARRVDRQPVLPGRHQRDRPGDGHVRRQHEHGSHRGTEGDDRRHPRAVPRLARPDLAGGDEVRQQPPERLRQLLLPEHQPGRREQARLRPKSSRPRTPRSPSAVRPG